MSARTADINATVTIVPTNGHKFKSDGVTCITLVDGLFVGKTLSNGKPVPFALSGFRVFKKWVAEANAQERAILKRLIEEVEG